MLLCGFTLPRAFAMVSNSSSSKSTGKRPSTIDEEFDVDKRRAIVSDLAAQNGVSKVGLAKTLKVLNDMGAGAKRCIVGIDISVVVLSGSKGCTRT